MATDYASLSTEELLSELEQAGRGPDPSLIETCLEREDELAPWLLDLFRQEVEREEPDWPSDDPRWFRGIHAGNLLIAYGETEALPLFKKALLDRRHEGLVEWFDTLLHAYGPDAVPMLIEVYEDRSTPRYNRILVVEFLGNIAADYPDVRDRVVDVLRKRIPTLTPKGKPVTGRVTRRKEGLWSWAALTLAELKDEESREQIEALFAYDLIDPVVMSDLEEYHDILHEDPPRASPKVDVLERYREEFERLERERQDEEMYNAFLEEERGKDDASARDFFGAPGNAYVPPKKKVGRNDPCLCGSGRKYKHCCG